MPAFGPQSISTITRQQIRGRLDAIVTEPGRKPSAERKLYVALMPVFKWAVERGAIDSNPMTDMTRQSQRRGASASWIMAKSAPCGRRPMRSTGLSARSTSSSCSPAPAVKRSLGCAGQSWTCNGAYGACRPRKSFSRSGPKTARASIDLSPQVVAIIEGLPRMHDGFVFSTTGRTPISGFGKAKARLDAAMEKHLGKPLRPFRVHDIRRTVASLMGDDLNVDQGVIERCLGHLTGRNRA